MTNNEGLHNSKSAPTNVFKKFNKQNSVSVKWIHGCNFCTLFKVEPGGTLDQLSKPFFKQCQTLLGLCSIHCLDGWEPKLV